MLNRLALFSLLFALSGVPFGTSASASIFSKRSSEPSVQGKMRDRYHVKRAAAIRTRIDGKLNTACLEAQLVHVEFDHVNQIAELTNYCETPIEKLPLDVRGLIEKIGKLNTKIADVIGASPEEVFSMGLEIHVSGSEVGSIGSYAMGDGIHLSVLPDWTVADFSSMVYAHEIIHILTFNPGPLAETLKGLEEHPYLIEALPDLMSATVHDSAILTLGEHSLPSCLLQARDETPVHSLNAPFSEFYLSGGGDKMIACCASLDLPNASDYVANLCNGFVKDRAAALAENEDLVTSNDLEAVALTDENLKLPFAAEQCVHRSASTGMVDFSNCDTHQFGFPLVSFFFRLQELTGHSQVSAFLKHLRSEAPLTTATYECGYAHGTETLGGEKVGVSLRPLLSAFVSFREALGAQDQAAFDRAWSEHAMAKMVDLDRIYRSETLSALARYVVEAKNTLFRQQYRCEGMTNFDVSQCQIDCRIRPGNSI